MKFMNSNARTFLLAKGGKQICETLNSVTSGGSIGKEKKRERGGGTKGKKREANYFKRG
jgi:hypothetical protein